MQWQSIDIDFNYDSGIVKTKCHLEDFVPHSVPDAHSLLQLLETYCSEFSFFSSKLNGP